MLPLKVFLISIGIATAMQSCTSCFISKTRVPGIVPNKRDHQAKVQSANDLNPQNSAQADTSKKYFFVKENPKIKCLEYLNNEHSVCLLETHIALANKWRCLTLCYLL